MQFPQNMCMLWLQALLLLAALNNEGFAEALPLEESATCASETQCMDTRSDVLRRSMQDCECGGQKIRLLHVSRHGGLQMEVLAMAQHLCCVEVQPFTFNDGSNVDDASEGLNYNVHKHRAKLVWQAYGAWFQTFDAVLVSDTTPMARPFLEFSTKPLFIWVCNRLDYANNAGDPDFLLAHTDMMQHGFFPDEDYYALLRKAGTQSNVSIVLSNGFEGHYALHWRGVDWSNALTIYPAGLGNRPSLLKQGGAGEGHSIQLPGQYGGHTMEALPSDEMLHQTVLVPDRGIMSSTCPDGDGIVDFFYNNERNLRVPRVGTCF